jgi:hypothetical protein
MLNAKYGVLNHNTAYVYVKPAYIAGRSNAINPRIGLSAGQGQARRARHASDGTQRETHNEPELDQAVHRNLSVGWPRPEPREWLVLLVRLA